ncbi:MAG: RNase P subunit p30 family protein [Candidatus Bathyarchaeia archaeon]
MRKFADLSLRPPLKDQRIQVDMANLAFEIGLSLIGLRFGPKDPPTQISSAVKTFERFGLEVAVGIEICPMTRRQLLDQLRSLRGYVDILAVKPTDSAVALTAAKDSRVDLISLERMTPRTKLSILKICELPVEIELSRIISRLSSMDHTCLNVLCREVELLNKHKAMVVISSGAKDVLTMRSPRDMACTLVSLGLAESVSLDAVSRVPYMIFNRNRDRRSSEFIGVGIKLARSRSI